MFAIAVCGASGSGKSTLSKTIIEKLGDRCVYLAQDCYYKNRTDLSFEERAKLNYDSPEAFDMRTLIDDINLLKSGKPITKKGYDYVNHIRADTNDIINPADVLLLDGIHSFATEELRSSFDLKIFIDVDADICILRRARRDMQLRGRDINGIIDQYITTVKPMYEKYIKNYSKYADLIISNSGNNPLFVDMLTFYIENMPNINQQ